MSSRALESLQARAEALGALLETRREGNEVAVPADLIASLFYSPEWSSLETATVDGLEATGRIALFRDPAVSERMAIRGARRAAVLLRQQEPREHFSDRVLPHLYNEIDIAAFVANRDPYRSGGASTAEFPWMDVEGSTRLTNTRPLRNLIQQRVLFLAATRIRVAHATRALEALLDTVQTAGQHPTRRSSETSDDLHLL